MSIALFTKLALFTVLTCMHATEIEPIKIEDFFTGKYDLDTIVERLDDIKAAITTPSKTPYPYNNPIIRLSMGIMMTYSVQEIESILLEVGFKRSNFRKDPKFTDFMMQKKNTNNINEMINRLKSAMVYLKKSLSEENIFSAVSRILIERAVEGVGSYIKQLEELKQANRLKFSEWSAWKIIATAAVCVVGLLVIIGLVMYLKRSY